MSSSDNGCLPCPRASISAFLIDEFTIRNVESLRSALAFIASFTALLMSSRSMVALPGAQAPSNPRWIYGVFWLPTTIPCFGRGARTANMRKAHGQRTFALCRAAAPGLCHGLMTSNDNSSAWPDKKPTALLVLADGTVLEGFGLGAEGQAVGEVCFNTAMTGYEEILTDPSYAGQLITFTFPHIGNVGTNDEDIETVNMAATPGARGVILRAAITEPSNYRAARHLDAWLKARGIIGLSGIDTRALTALIRGKGMPNAVIAHARDGKFDLHALKEEAREWPGLEGMDLVPMVTSGQRFTWDETSWLWDKGYGRQDKPEFNVVAIDYGIKRNILRLLSSVGCKVTVVPATTSAEDIMALKPDGVFLSNGPGDPAETGKYAVPVIRQLLDEK